MLANAVYLRLQQLFGADVGYSGLISKNPIHEQWRTYSLRKKPYTLTELSSKLDIDWQEAKKTPQQHEAIGLGPNCYIFIRHVIGRMLKSENIVERPTIFGYRQL